MWVPVEEYRRACECACTCTCMHVHIWGCMYVRAHGYEEVERCLQWEFLFLGTTGEPGEGSLVLSSQLPEQKTKCGMALGCLL